MDPVVVYKYPVDSALLNDNIPLFCFPEGVRIKKLKRTASNSRINEVRYSGLGVLEDPSRSFTFMLTGLDEVLYGVCVHSEEMCDEVPSVCSSKDEPLRARRPTNAVVPANSAPAVSALRCYCLMTRFPFFDLHFKFLYALLGKDRLVRQAGGDASEVEDLLRAYNEQRVPKEGNEFAFKLPGDVHQYSFLLPGRDQDSLLTEWSAKRLFTLSVDTMATLLAVLLQEYKLVVQSQQLGVLTTFVLGLIPLIKPFVWQGAFVPILPLQGSEALDSPTPSIFGVRSFSDMPSSSLLSTEDFAFLDLDKGTIRAPDGMVRLPREDALRKQLQLGTFQAQKHKPAPEAMEAVHTYIKDELRRVENAVKEVMSSQKGNVSVETVEWDNPDQVAPLIAAVSKNKKDHVGFYNRLFNSQMWMGHVGAKLSEKEREVRATQAAIALQQEKQREAQRLRANNALGKKYDALILAERATVKELEGQIADFNRRLVMARERLESLLISKQEVVELQDK